MAALAMTLLVLQLLTGPRALHRLYYRCEVSKNLVSPGEKFTITTTVENHKRMMVPNVRMMEHFPPDITLYMEADELFRGATDVQLISRFYMMGKEIYTREIEASLPKRGSHHFRPAIVYGGDFLGLEEHEQFFPVREEVVVMPDTVDCAALDQMVGDFLGDLSVNRFILEDPMLTIGFSEYTGREPMRAISWKQTCRLGQMMVKNYDHTLDLSVTILLNIKTDHLTEESLARIEDCYRLTRAVCEMLEEKRVKYNFFTNATIMGFAGTWSNVGEGLGETHFNYLMEGLGRAMNYATSDFSRVLERVELQADRSSSFLIISPYDDDEWQPALQQLRRRAYGSVRVLTPDILGEQQSYQPTEEVSA